jgi:hypothetical protein
MAALEDLNAETAELKLEEEETYKEIHGARGFALVIVNDSFVHDNECMKDDKTNILKFCNRAKFTVNNISKLQLKLDDENFKNLQVNHEGGLKTNNLTAEEMVKLFETISKGDFTDYDAFICFISSHGSKEGIWGCDGESVPLQKIIDCIENSTGLQSGKPKIFFTQNCSGTHCSYPVHMQETADSADYSDNAVTEYGCNPFAVPELGADFLVASSSVGGCTSFRDKWTGSWFITDLTRVFRNHAHNTSLTSMLTIVNKEIAARQTQKGWKQMSCYLTTLKNPVYFNVSNASKAPSALQEESSTQKPREL